MTDLERVRELLRDYPQMYTDDLDAHLKEDVERVEAYENLLTNLGDNFNEVKAELASLREENERYRAAQDGRFEDIVATLRTAEAENARLREENENLNARLKDADTQGQRIETLQDELARLREATAQCPYCLCEFGPVRAAIAEVEGSS